MGAIARHHRVKVWERNTIHGARVADAGLVAVGLVDLMDVRVTRPAPAGGGSPTANGWGEIQEHLLELIPIQEQEQHRLQQLNLSLRSHNWSRSRISSSCFHLMRQLM